MLPVAVLTAVALVAAATPTPRVNYQGGLRNATGDPLNGAYEMTFRFFSLDSGGDEILTDTRALMTPAGPVTVANGLFSATLGDGAIADGSGPGTYTDLAQVFREYGVVWLKIKIGIETLSPRMLVTASAYALNASSLEGKSAASFLDTSAAFQIDVIVGGIATLRVDATYGAILPGDLLTATATPGHAMRSPDATPGTVVAKGLEPLETGTGTIRVLVLSR